MLLPELFIAIGDLLHCVAQIWIRLDLIEKPISSAFFISHTLMIATELAAGQTRSCEALSCASDLAAFNQPSSTGTV